MAKGKRALLALLCSAALVLGACVGASIVSLVSDPLPHLLPAWQCNAHDGSVTQGGVLVNASLPCNWGLTEAATPSASCAGAELLVTIGRKEVGRQKLQLVLTTHTEDISWSDPFAAVHVARRGGLGDAGCHAAADSERAAQCGTATAAL